MCDTYNVIVSSFSREFSRGEFVLTTDRVFKENSSDAASIFNYVSESSLSYAANFPTLFMYEAPLGENARIGKIKRVQLRGNEVRVLFEFLPDIAPISCEKIWEMRWDLNLADHEFNRRHWAIKCGNLIETMEMAGIYTSDHLVDALADSLKELTVASSDLNIEAYKRRINDALPKDPALAIGATKEMIEAVMKTILAKRGVDGIDVLCFPDLMNRSLTELGLKSTQRPTSDVEKNLRQIASGAQKILDAVNSLRNVAGTGHGRVVGSEHEVPVTDAQFVSALGFVVAAWLLRHHRASP